MARLTLGVLILNGGLAGQALAGDRDAASAPVTAGDEVSAPEQVQALGLLPLGKHSLREQRSHKRLARGVTLTTIVRGAKRAPRGRILTTARGPWRIRVLQIDPRKTRGHLRVAHGGSLSRTARTSALVRSVGGLAGVNASYFSLSRDRKNPGDPVGITISRGRVISTPGPVASETAFVVDARTNKARITRLSWQGALTNRSTGEVLRVDAINQKVISPKNCVPPNASGTRCHARGDVVMFTPEWARRTPAGRGVEVVLDGDGCAVRTKDRRGLRLRAGQVSVQASGERAEMLLAHLAQGCTERSDVVLDGEASPLRLTRSTFAATGRYQILDQGATQVPDASGAFFHRHSRTIAGIGRHGEITLVTIDGHRRSSVGASLAETAAIAQSLGLVNAINLDGGGSTAMVVRGKAINTPRDGHERAVGDALVWVPKRWK